MNRRQFTRTVASLTAIGAGLGNGCRAEAATADAEPVDAPFVDPALAQQAPASTDERDLALAIAFEHCAAAAQTCVRHCRQSLAGGNARLADCLRAAQDCDAIATAVARLARNGSAWAAVVAKQSIAMLDACVEACRPLREQHPACKACFEACGKAIATTRAA